jgi:nicotinamide mononucleotide transporter
MSQPWSEVLTYVTANWTELLGSLTGIVCVWLLVKQNIWNWPIGIANNIFYVFIFFKSGLFADMGLQFLYLCIALYGWWNWLHGGNNRSELSVARTSPKSMLGYCGITAASTAILYWLLRSFTPSTVPFADGLTTSLFLTAQFMMSRKLVENWWFWIVGDVLVIALYIYKHLYLTTGLYLAMLAMCVVALVEWQRATKKDSLASISAAV